MYTFISLLYIRHILKFSRGPFDIHFKGLDLKLTFIFCKTSIWIFFIHFKFHFQIKNYFCLRSSFQLKLIEVKDIFDRHNFWLTLIPTIFIPMSWLWHFSIDVGQCIFFYQHRSKIFLSISNRVIFWSKSTGFFDQCQSLIFFSRHWLRVFLLTPIMDIFLVDVN